MIIAGLHFGHDGAVCIVQDGKIISYVMREREIGVKHALGITTHEFTRALSEANITADRIDAFALTSTQGVELLTGLIEGFDILPVRHAQDEIYSRCEEIFKANNTELASIQSFGCRSVFESQKPDSWIHDAFSSYFIERDRYMQGEIIAFGSLESFVWAGLWDETKDHTVMAEKNLRSVFEGRDVRNGFHHPLTVSYQGKTYPAYYIQHHVAHLASSYYRSGFESAMVFSHDGYNPGESYGSGLIAIGHDQYLAPVLPHHLVLGHLYEMTAIQVLGNPRGAPGKLMGLAPYGKPRYFDPRFVGNYFEIKAATGKDHTAAWLEYCGIQVRNYHRGNIEHLAQKDHLTDPINADIAASVQKLFEEGLLRTINLSYRMTQVSGIASDNLCLSGGTALNCPANSKLFSDTPFDQIYVEPNCTDDGLCIGSALYVFHHLYEHPLSKAIVEDNQSPYQGPAHGLSEIEQMIHSNTKLKAEKLTKKSERAAQDLDENKVIAWFEGKSEMGPRALGHRSIIAHPGYSENWKRVNQIKKREEWRPFAPAVLEEHAAEWFAHTPLPSPYMLFTGEVRSQKIPAVTHVDNSARIQTVSVKDGEYYEMIKAFHARSGLPVVMNTSFNGPRQPIIEYPKDALAFLENSEIDALYIGEWRITKAA